jgi:hypothetical protein
MTMTFTCVTCSAHLDTIDNPTVTQLMALGAAMCSDCKFNRASGRKANGRFAATSRPVATITRTADRYYILTRPDGTELGCQTKDMLTSYARTNGWTAQHVDARDSRRIYRAGR